MILQRLTVFNFRQYKGEHTLEFSIDSQKNVSVVTGMNGAGKTALFYALNWVLYGEARALPGLLINKDVVASGENPVAWVQLQFIHEGAEFVARREMVRSATGQEREEAFLLQQLHAGGRVETFKNPDAKVNLILPSDARRYFFFDGERIDEMSRPGHEREIQDAVRSVLKLKALERSADHLDSIAAEYARSLKQQGALNEEEVQLLERIEKLDTVIKHRTTLLQDERERGEILQTHLEQTRAKLDQLSEVKVLQSQERELEGRRTRLEAEQSQLGQRLQRAVNEGSTAIVIDAIGQARSIVDAKREKGEIPSGIQQQLIDDLLRSGECICGRPLDEQAAAALRSRHRSASSKVEVDAVLNLASELRALEVQADASRQSVRDALSRRKQVADELTDLQRELQAIADKRSTGFSEQVSELEETRALLVQRGKDSALQQGRLEAEITRDQKQLELARAKLAAVQSKTVKSKVGKLRYQLAQNAALATRRMLAEFATDMRGQIEAATDEIFKTFVWKEKQFDSVHVTEDYKLEVEDRFHTASLAGLSAGERQVLSLSFIAGMSRVTGEEAPLVIDTPFGRLSDLVVASVVETLPGIAKQLVLFVTDHELSSDDSWGILAPRVGKSYRLDFDDETGITSIEKES